MHEWTTSPLPSGFSPTSGIATTSTPSPRNETSVHKTYVFRIDRNDGAPWVARAFPSARPCAGVEGDAAVLRFLERQEYPAERLAVDDAVSDFDGSVVLVTQFIEGDQLPAGAAKFAMMGELLGRLHALPYDDSVSRPGGASGEDPSREGTPRQDLLAALSFLDAVDTKVAAAERARFEQLQTRCGRQMTVTAFRRACCTGISSTLPITPS